LAQAVEYAPPSMAHETLTVPLEGFACGRERLNSSLVDAVLVSGRPYTKSTLGAVPPGHATTVLEVV
jgi:hypothetical protein